MRYDSRTTAPKENCPNPIPNPKPNPNLKTNRGQFARGKLSEHHVLHGMTFPYTVDDSSTTKTKNN